MDFWIAKGWLGLVSKQNCGISLFNPLTRSWINLPRLDEDTIDYFLKYISPRNYYEVTFARKKYVSKLAISSDLASTSTEKCQIAIIFTAEGQKLGIWLLNEGTGWQEVLAWKNPLQGLARYNQTFHGVLCVGGKIYALSSISVRLVEYTGSGLVAETEIGLPIVEENLYPVSQRYIVLLCNGDLLYLARHIYRYKTFKLQRRNAGMTHFDVFRLELGKNSWTQIFDLGGKELLFIGSNESIAFCTTKCPWLRPNCIYFADDNHHSVSMWSAPAFWYQNVV